jgi:nitroreductase
MNTFIENQQWRYATKKFDATKKISTKDFDILKEAMRLSASSYGLQPYKIIIIDNPEIRSQILPFAWNQKQIVEASELLIFANVINFGANEIDEHIKNMASTRGLEIESLQGYADFMKAKITNLPIETRNIWTSKQTYLALGNLMNAAAELKIDVTPMEGFEPDNVNELLGLENMGLSASLIATVGYRHSEDQTQYYPKVRKSNQNLFVTI